MSLVLALIALSVVMLAAWLWQRRTRNIGWVDVFWTFGTATSALALALAWRGPESSLLRLALTCGLAAVWAVRLGLFVAFRVAAAKEEDGRYRALREEWGANTQPRLFAFLQLQAVVALVLGSAIALAAIRPVSALTLQDLLGALLAIAAIGGEAVADQQLRRFASDPANRGKVCDVGLWSWSRHPNYFFEWLGWFAYPAFAIDLSGAYPWGWLSLLAPLVMFGVLRFGTGVPPLEDHMLRSRGDAFRAYQARVSAFLPRPPKSQGT